MKELKILHSFPAAQSKFREHCMLAFDLPGLKNEYVDSLLHASNIGEYDFIVLHYLRDDDCTFIVSNEFRVPLVCFIWGAEIFEVGKFYNAFILPKTKRFRRRIGFKVGKVNGIKQLIKEQFPFISELRRNACVRLRAIKRMTLLIPVVPTDVELIRDMYGLELKSYHINYVNPLLEEVAVSDITGSNILLGNSATFSNNHFDAIDVLCHKNLEGRQVIIPLNYGNQILAKMVTEYAKEKLGIGNVRVLDDYLDFKRYNDLMCSCEIIIMNHVRQQALGNIVQGLVNGSHIYLNSDSGILRYLIKCGFIVSLFNTSAELRGLDKEERQINRELVYKVFGREAQQTKILELIKMLLKK